MAIDLGKPLFIAAVVSSSAMFGGMLFTSAIMIPTVLESAPSAKTLAVQWRGIFTRGIRIAPAIGVFSAASFFGCAYVHHHPQLQSRTTSFVLAGLATLGFAPWTFFVMNGTNDKLMKLADGFAEDKIDEAQAPEVRNAVTFWGNMNLLRSLFPLAGTLLGFQAL